MEANTKKQARTGEQLSKKGDIKHWYLYLSQMQLFVSRKGYIWHSWQGTDNKEFSMPSVHFKRCLQG